MDSLQAVEESIGRLDLPPCEHTSTHGCHLRFQPFRSHLFSANCSYYDTEASGSCRLYLRDPFGSSSPIISLLCDVPALFVAAGLAYINKMISHAGCNCTPGWMWP